MNHNWYRALGERRLYCECEFSILVQGVEVEVELVSLVRVEIVVATIDCMARRMFHDAFANANSVDHTPVGSLMVILFALVKFTRLDGAQ